MSSNESTVATGQKEAMASTSAFAPDREEYTCSTEKYLLEGKLKAGESALLSDLKLHNNDDNLRFGLGILQFLRAVEQLGQDFYRYGLRGRLAAHASVPILNLPVPTNPNPETLGYNQARKIIQTFDENLGKAQATLEPIADANVKVPLHFGLIRLDLKGDGKIDEDESLWKIYNGVNGNRNVRPETAKNFYICFDRGDVHWLRGYCHLLMTLCEVYLAHDSSETFNCTAHVFFDKVDSPYKFLTEQRHTGIVTDHAEVLDLISLIHLIRWPVVEPDRMKSALSHLEAVTAQSKESWKWIMAETDDDHEWLPNPRQTGVIPNARVTDEMVDAWMHLMDQSGKVLAGEELIPFWRGKDSRGINLRKVFLEPRTLDLVLWVQGPAAAPYLEKGKMVDAGTWNRLQTAFGSQFPGFALWFN